MPPIASAIASDIWIATALAAFSAPSPVRDIFMLSENQYHPGQGRLDIQYTFIRGGEVETRPSSSFTFTVAEICRMHLDAGLETIELLGSIAGEPYQLGSPRLILISALATHMQM